jgi:hypothetical protein
MGFYDTKGDLAQSLVEKFTLGNIIIKNISSETYNTTTGQVTRSTTEKTVPYVAINRGLEAEQNWVADTFMVYVSGNDLAGFIPEINSIVTMPDGSSHNIREIEPYPNNIAFKLYISKDVCQV